MKNLLLIALIFGSFSSFAKVGYVNTMLAFEKTKQGQRVKKRLEKATSKAKKDFKAEELKIQKEEADLKKEAPLLSEQARAEKIQKLQQQIFNFQKKAKDKDVELQNLQNEMMGPVLKNLKKVIGEVAQKEGYTVVKNISNDVLWVSAEMDLTTKVYQRFNKKYK